jgi:hypothetical protein
MGARKSAKAARWAPAASQNGLQANVDYRRLGRNAPRWITADAAAEEMMTAIRHFVLLRALNKPSPECEAALDRALSALLSGMFALEHEAGIVHPDWLCEDCATVGRLQ